MRPRRILVLVGNPINLSHELYPMPLMVTMRLGADGSCSIFCLRR